MVRRCRLSDVSCFPPFFQEEAENGAFEFQWRERRLIFRTEAENGAFELQVGTKQGHFSEIPGAQDVNSPLEIYIPGRGGKVVEKSNFRYTSG